MLRRDIVYINLKEIQFNSCDENYTNTIARIKAIFF